MFFHYLGCLRKKRKTAHLTAWCSSKESACQCRKCRRGEFHPYVGKTPWRRKCNPLQYFCLGSPMGRGIWQAPVPGVAESQTWLSNWACTRILNCQNPRWILPNTFPLICSKQEEGRQRLSPFYLWFTMTCFRRCWSNACSRESPPLSLTFLGPAGNGPVLC